MEEKETKKKTSSKKEDKIKKERKVAKGKENKPKEDKKVNNIDKEIKKDEIKQVKEEKKKLEENVINIELDEKKKGFNSLEVVIIMFITLCFGGLIGSALTYAVSNKEEIITSIPVELNEFVNTYEDIIENYYEEIDHKELLNSGIEGMLDFLGDRYSVYMDEEATKEFDEQVEGKYVGIGSEIQRLEDGSTIISNPFEDGPAAKAGLQKDDVILKVNGESIEGLDLSEISSKVKGKSGTKVTLTIKRGEEELDVVVIRGEVEITSAIGRIIEMNDKKVGLIDIEIFASNTANQFEKELLRLEGEGITSLIIDVRDNSGGYLTTVEEISALLLEKGKNIYKLDTKGIVDVKKDSTKTSRSYPISVLINKYSASASEILASAIKESYSNGEVIGVNSYGKGTVQKAYKLESGATVKYTIQKWLTPDGNWINEKGVEPTKVVEQSEEYYQDPTDEKDTQLQEALKLLTGEKEEKKENSK